jgi:hypothetical protein
MQLARALTSHRGPRSDAFLSVPICDIESLLLTLHDPSDFMRATHGAGGMRATQRRGIRHA